MEEKIENKSSSDDLMEAFENDKINFEILNKFNSSDSRK